MHFCVYCIADALRLEKASEMVMTLQRDSEINDKCYLILQEQGLKLLVILTEAILMLCKHGGLRAHIAKLFC